MQSFSILCCKGRLLSTNKSLTMSIKILKYFFNTTKKKKKLKEPQNFFVSGKNSWKNSTRFVLPFLNIVII